MGGISGITGTTGTTMASLEKREHTVPEGFINETIRRTRDSPRST